jgi:hypothetical protein
MAQSLEDARAQLADVTREMDNANELCMEMRRQANEHSGDSTPWHRKRFKELTALGDKAYGIYERYRDMVIPLSKDLVARAEAEL